MIDAPFSSPDGEPSMEKGDEENALQKSNRNQLPSLSTPNDQTNSEGEETALKALCELDDNNVNRKTNEGAKQCEALVIVSLDTKNFEHKVNFLINHTHSK